MYSGKIIQLLPVHNRISAQIVEKWTSMSITDSSIETLNQVEATYKNEIINYALLKYAI